MNLILTANGKAQELILAYLKENVSDVLVKKINDGTPFTKDGKTLINKKTLDGFMKYANSEAKKLAEKGANAACVEDNSFTAGLSTTSRKIALKARSTTRTERNTNPLPRRRQNPLRL